MQRADVATLDLQTGADIVLSHDDDWIPHMRELSRGGKHTVLIDDHDGLQLTAALRNLVRKIKKTRSLHVRNGASSCQLEDPSVSTYRLLLKG